MKTNKPPIGRQYASRSSALRAINRYLQYVGFNNIGRVGLWVNKIKEGCYEIC